MNKFVLFLSLALFMLLPVVVMSQPVPHHHRYLPDEYVKRCYTVLFPIPHTYCEYVRVLNYTPIVPPPNRHYMPGYKPRYVPMPPNHRHHKPSPAPHK